MPPPRNYASLLRERRGFLATSAPEGPHLVPVCFTWAGDVIWTAVDDKPKRTEELQRLKDIQGSPMIAFTVDRWDEDWSRLAWLQARGRATEVTDDEEIEKAQTALRSKYPQYEAMPLNGPVIRIEVERWIGWSAE